MRDDSIGLFWEDLPETRKRGERVLGPLPPIPDTGWTPPTELPQIYDAPWIALDCETYDPELITAGPGWARGRGHIVGVSICTPKGKWYFPIRHTVQTEMNLDADRVMSWLKFSLSNNQPKIGANLMYDIGWLMQEGITVNGPLYDVQFAEGLLDETSKLSLDDLGWRYLHRGKTTYILKDWAQGYYGTGEKHWRKDIYRCPPSLVGFYAEDDAAMPYEILMKQWPLLTQRGLLELFHMECKLMRLLIRMRFAGMTIDIPYVERYRDELEAGEIAQQASLNAMTGMDVSVNSGSSLKDVFDKFNIPYELTDSGNPSFTKDYLNGLTHPIARKIVELRELIKLRTTFVESYLLNSHINGKVYCSFHPIIGEKGGAKTGRFSSSDPNFQNIPVRTAAGKKIRRAFIKDLGHRGVRFGDYSQVEYRMLAHFATGPGSDEVRAEYNNNPKLDYHDMISYIINRMTGFAVQIKSGEILPGKMVGNQPLIREQIKTLNFALVYGVGKDHLAEMLGVAPVLAMEIIAAFHQAVPFAKATMQSLGEEVSVDGICRTILNRQTHFDLWEPSGFRRKGKPLPYGQALDAYGPNIMRAYLFKTLNYRLQGSAADVMKKAMVDADEAGIFDEIGVPRLTVHDELGFSDDGEGREEAWRELVHIAENPIKFKVPLRFDLKAGQHWAECK